MVMREQHQQQIQRTLPLLQQQEEHQEFPGIYNCRVWKHIIMANGNQGIGSFLPFPTFGGEKSGGITPVQLQPMRPNFPTPRLSRASAPASVSPLASLAPGILALLSQNIFKPEEIVAPEPTDAGMSDTYTLEDIRKELEDPQQADFAAQQIYGPGGKLTRGQKVGRYLLENAPALFFDDPRE